MTNLALNIHRIRFLTRHLKIHQKCCRYYEKRDWKTKRWGYWCCEECLWLCIEWLFIDFPQRAWQRGQDDDSEADHGRRCLQCFADTWFHHQNNWLWWVSDSSWTIHLCFVQTVGWYVQIQTQHLLVHSVRSRSLVLTLPRGRRRSENTENILEELFRKNRYVDLGCRCYRSGSYRWLSRRAEGAVGAGGK